MGETGRIALFRAPGKPFEVREFPLPEVEPDAILIKVTISNICGSDLHSWRGDSRPDQPQQDELITFGHEMTGRVYRLGSNIKTDSLGTPLKEGDLVVYPYFYPCRRCEVCLEGNLAACQNKRHPIRATPTPPYFKGAFGDYYYLRPGHFVFKAPEGLPDELLASVNCAFSQVAFGLHRVGLTLGENIVIQGAGGLGINAIAVARERGAAKIIVIDGIKERLELAKAFGADETIDINEYPTHRERIARVRALTGGQGAHVAAELVGIPAVISEGLSMLRPGGRYLIIGSITGDSVPIMPLRLIGGNRSMVGVGFYDPWIIPKVVNMIARTKDRYPYGRLSSKRFPLEKIDQAFEQAEWVNRKDGGRLARASIVP